jgi:hypothetical protein
MVRTQVQLTEQQINALRQASTATGRSIADLIRQGVDQYLSSHGRVDPEERIRRALRVAGRFSSGASDVSSKHDKYLADAFHR